MIIDIKFYRCYILVITADSYSSLYEFIIAGNGRNFDGPIISMNNFKSIHSVCGYQESFSDNFS